MIIKKEALKLLAIMGSSCKSLGEKRVENVRYICRCAAVGVDMELDLFLAGFPEKYMAYKLLEVFAAKEGETIIDEELAIKFFGGSDHLAMIEGQLCDYESLKGKVEKTFRNKFTFGHMIIPVEITRKHPIVCGKYLVAGRKIHVQGLIMHPLSFNGSREALDVGSEYLVHFATIIVPASAEMSSWIRGEHIKNKKFLKVLDSIANKDYQGTIDNRKFWDLYEWTKEMLKECGF